MSTHRVRLRERTRRCWYCGEWSWRARACTVCNRPAVKPVLTPAVSPELDPVEALERAVADELRLAVLCRGLSIVPEGQLRA